MLQIYTGSGKGKTTASIGQLIRFIGYGQKAIFSQFLKTTQTGEVLLFQEHFKEKVLVIRNDKSFPFSNKMTLEEKQEIKEIHNNIFSQALENFRKDDFRLLVLDEIISTYNLDLINKKMVDDFILNFDKDKEIIITGRECPKLFLEKADYISDIKSIINPFDAGINARKGIEF